jgi:hypothetical protein
MRRADVPAHALLEAVKSEKPSNILAHILSNNSREQTAEKSQFGADSRALKGS